MYEVRHGLDLHRVCLKEYICTCKKWQICGIPCEHAYGVIIHKKLDPEDFVCQWFKTAMWKRNYTDGICPQRGPKFWPETDGAKVYVSEPPEGEEKDKKMTKAEKKRKKVVNESPTKKQPKAKNKESCIVVFVGWQIIIQDTIKMIRYWDILFMYVAAVVLDYTNIIQLFFFLQASQSVSQLSQPEPSQGSLTQA